MQGTPGCRGCPNVPIRLDLSISNIFTEFFEFVEDVWNNDIVPAFKSLGRGIDKAVEEIKDFFENVGEDIEKIFVDVFDEVSEWTTQAINDALEAVEDTWDDFVSLFESGGFFDDVFDE